MSGKRVPHRWIIWRFGYPLCVRCGLIWLKNLASNKAARRQCSEEE